MTYHLLEIVTYIIELHIISTGIVLFTGKYLYLTYWRKGTTLLVKFTVHVYVAQDLRQWLSPQHHHSISNKTSKGKRANPYQNSLFLLYLSNVSTCVLKLYKLQNLIFQLWLIHRTTTNSFKIDWQRWFLRAIRYTLVHVTTRGWKGDKQRTK